MHTLFIFSHGRLRVRKYVRSQIFAAASTRAQLFAASTTREGNCRLLLDFVFGLFFRLVLFLLVIGRGSQILSSAAATQLFAPARRVGFFFIIIVIIIIGGVRFFRGGGGTSWKGTANIGLFGYTRGEIQKRSQAERERSDGCDKGYRQCAFFRKHLPCLQSTKIR